MNFTSQLSAYKFQMEIDTVLSDLEALDFSEMVRMLAF